MAPPTIVFRGGRVLTMDPHHRVADVLVVEGDRIVAVGPAGLERSYPDASVEDLRGRTLVPGFIDAHCHLSIAALQPRWGDASSCVTPEDLGAVLADQSAREPLAEWIRAGGWDEVTTGLRFDRHDLDLLTGDRPAIVVHQTFHQAVVNSAGLDRLGLPDDATVPGLLVERDFGRAHTASMAGYDDPDRWAELVAARARWLLSLGITAVHDAACDPAAESLYARMARTRELPLSVLMMPHPAPFLSHDFGDRLAGPTTGEGDEWLRVGPLKFFADGGVLPAIDVHLRGDRIAFGYRHPDLVERLPEAVAMGFRVGVHAMGNQGIADTLGAFREAARRRADDDHRFRIEHAGLAGSSLVSAIAALGAVAVVQPGFVDHVGENVGDFVPDDASWLPFGALADAGVTLAGSSDDPCGPADPLVAGRFGATRCTHTGRSFGPDQALPLPAWLEAYTCGAAYAGGQEHERGSLHPGLRADLVVLDGGNSGRPPDDQGPLRVAQTWVAGRLVHGTQAGQGTEVDKMT